MTSVISESFINDMWENSIVPALTDYIKIPNKSPMFDHAWREHGYMQQAVDLLANWAKQQAIPGLKLEVVQEGDRTPVILVEIPGASEETILLYGHLDKQPEMVGWAEDLGPWKPVRKQDLLYGRGAADDGYALFASLTAILALQKAQLPHARCVVLIEACEESGSYDLPFYIDHLSNRIGNPSFIVCLDSGCGNYDQLWSTTSLRGLVSGDLTVEVLAEGIHSGVGSGVVPSSFRILRELLSRVENQATGKILLSEFNTEIPIQRSQQAEYAAKILGNTLYTELPFVANTQPMTHDLVELILNRTWRPTLSITGADGLPSLENAGNVLRPKTAVKVSMRVPPNCNTAKAGAALKKTLEENPPYQAKVSFNLEKSGAGWDAPPLADWLAQASNEASELYYGKPAAYLGEGGSIPFMGMLGEKFPQAQFLITGVLGPHSNAHGPNEFINIAYAKKLTACVAYVIAKQFSQSK